MQVAVVPLQIFPLSETKKRPPWSSAHSISTAFSSAVGTWFCFVEKELEAQRGAVTFSESHSQQMSELELNSDP